MYIPNLQFAHNLPDLIRQQRRTRKTLHMETTMWHKEVTSQPTAAISQRTYSVAQVDTNRTVKGQHVNWVAPGLMPVSRIVFAFRVIILIINSCKQANST